MSFCQKHSNHHCVHSHNCKDKTHNKQKSKTQKHTKLINSRHKLAQIQQENQECAFNFQHDLQNCQASFSDKEKTAYLCKIDQLKTQNMKLSRDFAKVDLQNKHLQAQMDYLRQQLQKIVSNSSADIKCQIQKHLEQNKNLCLRIKQLSLQIQELTNKLIDQENNMDTFRIDANKYKKQRDNLSKKLKGILQKSQKQTVRNLQANKKNINYQELNKDVESRYIALSKQSQFTIQQFSQQIEHLKKGNQKLLHQNQRLKLKQKRSQQLHQIDINLWKQKQNKLADTISKLKESLSLQQKNNKTLKQKIQGLQQNYEHSKNIILKLKQTQTNLGAFNQKVKQHEEQKITVELEDKTIPKISIQKNQQDLLKKYTQLEKQNSQLKTRLDQFHRNSRPLQTHNHNINILNCEEYILKIGASQAFKKIIEQKNKIITNLMKEKSRLNEKLFENQAKKR